MVIAAFLAKNGIGAERPAFLSMTQIDRLALELGISVNAAMRALLDHAIWPERFRRNCGVISAAAQARLLSLRVFLAGCGGLGGEFASLLTRIGCGALRICDPDVFTESNLNRQRFCTESALGRPKVDVAKECLLEIASYLEIEALPVAVSPANLAQLLEGADIAVDCLDSVPRKKMLEQAATAAGIPYLHGSVLAHEGFASLDIPGGNRLGSLYPDIAADNVPMGGTPVLATTVTATAALMASLLLNWLTAADADPHTPLFHLDCSIPELEGFSV